MLPRHLLSPLLLFAAAAMQPSAARSATLPEPTRADLALLSATSPVILIAKIDDADHVRRARAQGVPPGFARMLVEADVQALLVGPQGVARRIEYLVDLPREADGDEPDIEGRRVLLFLDRTGTTGAFRLSHKYGQVEWSAEREAAVRRYAREALAGDQLRPSELRSAFHVEGSLPGEAESQFFFETEDGRPMSIVVLSRPGQPQRYAVATGDIIDAGAEPPDPLSLTAIRLACGLPREVPPDLLADTNQPEALARDYSFVRDELPDCDRSF